MTWGVEVNPLSRRTPAAYRAQVHHLTVAEKSLLVGDEAAAALMHYAAHVGQLKTADTVHVRAIGIDGERVVATLLLNSGTVLAAETSRSDLPEPDNAELIAYVHTQMAQFDLPGALDPAD